MPMLNDADNVRYGTKQVSRVYRGTTLVWQDQIPMNVVLTALYTQQNAGAANTLTAVLTPAVPPAVATRSIAGTVRFRTGSISGPIIATVGAPWTFDIAPTVDTTYFAEYLGSDPYLPANSTGLAINIAAVTAVSLTSDKNSVAQGGSVVLTATVSGTTTGTVNFRSGSPTGPIIATDTASPWTTTVTPTGDTTYYAEYLGTPDYQPGVSTGKTIDFYIPTTTSITSSKASINAGESITLTGTVAGVTAGTIQFRAGSPTGTIVGTDSSAPWSCTVTPSGPETYYAEYLGSGDYAASTSSGVAVAYNAPTSITISADPTSVAAGSSVTLTATVTGASTGTVNFRRDSPTGTIVGSDTSKPWTLVVTPSADTTYYAEYVANGNYQGSVSAGVAVDRYITTSTSISVSPTDINDGDGTTLTATVSGGGAGTVDFIYNGGVVATVNGPPYSTVRYPTPGGQWYTYQAKYRANGDYLASTSGDGSVYVRKLVTHAWGGYATWAQSYTGTGAQRSDAGSSLYYGYYSSNQGNQRSMIGFDFPDFRGTVAVTGVRVMFYNSHHFLNSGGSIPVGLHESGGKPGTYCCAYENLQTLGNAPKPGWCDNWMNSNFTSRVKASLIKGFTLGPGPSTSTNYYGYSTTTQNLYMEVQYQTWD